MNKHPKTIEILGPPSDVGKLVLGGRGGAEIVGYYTVYWGYIGIMEKNMETTLVYRGCTGIMKKEPCKLRVHCWDQFHFSIVALLPCCSSTSQLQTLP